ncbi:hypothetical protein LIER_12939 [Lithospermum erythrorhizon]|uniref:Uncharacterized protein n=1 Tax=Lithospermum erythrorhizon TaxID=34254 RepID=A0AAV3PTU0_LITER
MLVDTGSSTDIILMYYSFSTPLEMKFTTTGGVGEASGDQKRAQVCYQLSVPQGSSLKKPPKQKRHKRNFPGIMKTTQPLASQDNSPHEKECLKKGSPHEELVVVSFSEQQPEKTFKIGTQLNPNHRNQLIKLLQRYKEMFARAPEDMPWVDANIAIHKLHVDPIHRPVKQKKRNFSEEKNHGICEEID